MVERNKTQWDFVFLTFAVCPIGIEVGQSSLVTYLFQRLLRFVVDLQNTTRPSPTAFAIGVVHIEIDASTSRGSRCRVKRRGLLGDDRGRHLGGIVG